MKLTKVLALILVLMLTIPAAGMAGENSGAYTLRFSDPVISMLADGENVTYDLTGLGVQLSAAADASGDPVKAMLSLVLLTGGEPAATAMGGIDGETLYALATGISNVYTIPVADARAIGENLAGDHAQSFNSGFETGVNIEEILGKLNIVEGEPQTVQFLDEAVENCPVKTLSITGAELKELANGQADTLDIPDDMVLDIMYATSGNGGLHFEGTAKGYEQDSDDDDDDDDEEDDDDVLDFVGNFELKDNSLRGEALIGDGSNQLSFAIEGGSDPDTGAASCEANLFATDLEDDETEASARFYYEQGEAEDGALAHLVTVEVGDGENTIASLDAVYMLSGQDESFSVSVGRGGNEPDAAMVYEGKLVETETSTTRDGEVNVWAKFRGEEYAFSSKCSTVLSSEVEGMLPDISNMTTIDYNDMTEEDLEALKSEANQLFITVLGKVMAVPAVANLLADSGVLSF